MKYNKAQAWGMDIIIAIIIFSIGILIFFIYSANHSLESKEKLDLLSSDGNFIMKNILSEGYPSNWNQTNVIKIGIINNNKIDEEKLEKFYNLCQTDYNKTKLLFNTKYDYLFYFQNMEINSNKIEGIGKPGINISLISDKATDLIKITRLTIYKDKPITVYLYIWEE
ncbi:MAG: hypothetical protein QXW97_04245 [Candidatus Pacearchaeota archaeon]